MIFFIPDRIQPSLKPFSKFAVFVVITRQLFCNRQYFVSDINPKKSGDGGIDGYINQDGLGLDKIFFQAKRFNENSTVSPEMIRAFIGTLDSKGVNKGVFITTSQFCS